MISTILAHYRGVRKLSGEACAFCEADDLRLGLCFALDSSKNIFSTSGKAGFSTSQEHPHLRVLPLRSK
jgi:hypothetical protein